MKQLNSTIAKITIAIAIAGTFAACKQGATDVKTPAAGPTATTPEKAEIVYVNQDSLLNKYEYFKDMTKRMQEKGKTANDEVNSKKQAFQREVGDYQKAAAGMSADQRAQTEQRLQHEGQGVQTYEQNATAEFQQATANENTKLYDKVADYVKTYAKEKGYKLVLTYSKTNPTVLFGDPSLDVTAEVVKGLNDLYAKDKK